MDQCHNKGIVDLIINELKRKINSYHKNIRIDFTNYDFHIKGKECSYTLHQKKLSGILFDFKNIKTHLIIRKHGFNKLAEMRKTYKSIYLIRNNSLNPYYINHWQN